VLLQHWLAILSRAKGPKRRRNLLEWGSLSWIQNSSDTSCGLRHAGGRPRSPFPTAAVATLPVPGSLQVPSRRGFGPAPGTSITKGAAPLRGCSVLGRMERSLSAQSWATTGADPRLCTAVGKRSKGVAPPGSSPAPQVPP